MNSLTRMAVTWTVVALFIGSAGPAAAQSSAPTGDPQRVRAGWLSCQVEGSVGFLIGSRREMTCVYNPSAEGQYRQYYRGKVSKWGLDIGATKKAVISWAVIGSTAIVPNGDLNGTFKGVSAEATAALGLGANLLIGGTGDGYVLQPLSLQTQSGGLKLAVGVTRMKLWLGQ